jgi:hypothetical protein
MAVIKFYIALKPHISHHHPLVKLIAFKLIVGLVFFENVSQKGLNNQVPSINLA